MVSFWWEEVDSYKSESERACTHSEASSTERWFRIHHNMRKRWIRKEQSDGIAKRACLHAKAERQHRNRWFRRNAPRGVNRAESTIPSIKKRHRIAMSFFWWEEVDSNHRRRCQQIYSLLPLATRESSHMELVVGVEPTTC